MSERTQRPDFQATSDPGLQEREATLLDYRELYALWERQQWAVQELDFTQDRIDWHERIPPEERFAAHVRAELLLRGRAARGGRAGADDARRARRGHAHLPVHADRRRGAPRRLLRPLLLRGRRARGRRPRGAPGRRRPSTSTPSSACSSTRCCSDRVDRLAARARGPRDAGRGGDDLPHGHRGDARPHRPALHHRLQRATRARCRRSWTGSRTSRATSTATSPSARASCATWCARDPRYAGRDPAHAGARSRRPPTACCARSGPRAPTTSRSSACRERDARVRPKALERRLKAIGLAAAAAAGSGPPGPETPGRAAAGSAPPGPETPGRAA